MTPPEAPLDGNASRRDVPPAASSCLLVLKKRSDFLLAARARKQGVGSMMVQARRRREGESETPNAIRVGFTCSKKVGNAVARNHAKRRMREVARAVLPTLGKPGWDYVLIGRADSTAARPFEDLKSDLRYALKKLHAPAAKRAPNQK
ncbi:ribonuclease P protein component [Cognatishimia maritima]|uniref:Ribonuclease P protein component n=1 Tax=Cognatishimia maritima TaxID=870908 RepID=A0A1M5MK08_9RHOB|nr:ribonuclease P protein component [Cognatishimia maritima]SHG77093.1 ribonuclease P protein component [Cognatishimia maritima]